MAAKINWERVLRKAANNGKKAILQNYTETSRRKVMRRGVGGDLTLRIDEVSENAIYESLSKDLGKDSFTFLSEEMGELKVEGDDRLPLVICDPLDGSHNAQVGIPFFSVSLSLINPRKGSSRTLGSIDAGFITSVKTEDEFFALKGKGSYQNGVKLNARRSASPLIQTLLVETGDVDFLRDTIIRNLSRKVIYKIRIMGSAALSYCMLANGTADAFIFAQPPNGARTIDSPAGYLIAREAGCVFADLSGRQANIDEVEVGFQSKIDLIGAQNAKILDRLTKLVQVT